MKTEQLKYLIGETFDLPQGYKFQVINVVGTTINGVMTEPLTNRVSLTRYEWATLEELIKQKNPINAGELSPALQPGYEDY